MAEADSKVSGIIEQIQTDGSNGTKYSIASTAYGYCVTGASTAIKNVNMTGIVVAEGVTIHVKFKEANSAANPKLKFNGEADDKAKPIVQYGTTAVGTASETSGWYAGAILTLTYDGTSWVRDQGFNTNSQAAYGNIATNGTLQTNDITIASGDKLVVTDASDSNKIARASLTFDGSTTTQALTKAGSWATFNNYSHPTTSGNKHVPSGGSSGQFLGWSADGTAQWVNNPNTDAKVAQSSNAEDKEFPIILKNTNNTTNETNGVKYDGDITINPSKSRITTTSLIADNIKINKEFNQLLTGTGTVASDGGASASPNRYKPAKWTFNAGFNPADGDMITIKIPVAGHDYGVFLSTNNGTNYYPIVCNGTGRLTTHYPVNTYLVLVFESTGSAASMFALAGSDSRVTVSNGAWRVINYYDSNSNYGYELRRIYPNLKAGGAIHPYSIIMQLPNGRWSGITTTPPNNPTTGTISPVATGKAASTSGYLLGHILIMYARATYADGNNIGTYNIWSSHTNLIDARYSFNLANSTGNGFTAYAPVYIVGTVSNGLFTLDSTKWWSQTLPSTEDGKIYIYIGDAYDWYRMTLTEDKPMYWYKDGAVRLYIEGRGIKTITRSGTTFTATRDDGTTFTFTQQDNAGVTKVSTGTGLTGGDITTTGTVSLADNYGDTKNPYASKTKNYVLAAPSNANGAPTFRALVAADIPSLSYLPLSGGTLTGALTTANNTWNTIGDDAYLGDINKAGHIGIQGKNGNTGIFFTTYNQTSKTTGGAITWDGSKFSITSTTPIDASISGNAANITGILALANLTKGDSNTALMGKGTSTAPAYVSVSPSISITAGTADNAPKINTTVLGVSGTAQELTKASTSVYGVTKLSAAADNNNLAATAKSVYDLASTVNGLLSAKDALVFKGTLDATNGTDSDSSTNRKTVPATGYSAGWVYKVALAGTYAGATCEIGDLVIAVSDPVSGQSAVNNAHWTVIQNNVDGAVFKGTNAFVNNEIIIADQTAGKVKSSGKSFSTATPSSSSTDAQIPTSKAVWAVIDTLDGNLNSTTPGAGKTLTAFSQTNGKISATFGNISITKSQISDFSHTHDYLPLSGGIMTGNIRRYYASASTEPMITALANNVDIYLFQVGHGDTAATNLNNNGYKLLYKGTNSSTNNYLQLIATKPDGTETIAIQIDEIGNIVLNTSTASTSTTTGALKVAGGLGVAGQVTATRLAANGSNTSYNLYVNGSSYLNGNTYSKAIILFNSNAIDSGSWLASTRGLAPTATTTDGTTTYSGAVTGTSILTLGNNKISANSASGVNDNAEGILRIYNSGSGYSETKSYNTWLYPTTGLAIPTDKVGIMFRPTSSSYYTHFSYQTANNEALVMATQNAVTSFIFINGESYANVSNTRWRSLTPALQIKNNSVIIGKLIDTGITPSYKFEVNGTSSFTSEVRIVSGTLWVQGGSEAGNDTNRMGLTNGMPTGLVYNTSKRGVRIYANAIAFADPLLGNSGNDAGWIRHIEETANTGTLEIAVGDDNANEQIVVRRYNTSSTIGKEIKLFDTSGNTSFPGTVTATSGFIGNLNGNATSANSAKYLMNRGAASGTNAVTIADSTWNPNQVPSGHTAREVVWKQRWTEAGLTYTPSGGSETTNTDTADFRLWLSSSNTSNLLQVNMDIDGQIYAMGGFKGNLNGTATTANNLSAAPTITAAGTATINLSANTTYTLTVGGKSVIFKTPADSNTNTATAADNILDGSNSGTEITYKPYTAQQTKLSFDTSTTNPTRTDRLNLNGYLYATKLYSGGTEVSINGHTHNGDAILGGYLNTHTENNGIFIPFNNNDIAFISQRGGSYTAYVTTSTDYTAATLNSTTTINIDNAFNGQPNYAHIGRVYTDVIIVDITCHRTFTYTTYFYIDFGSASWRAKTIRVLVLNSTDETTYTQKGSIENNANGHYVCNVAHRNGTGFNKIRVVLGDWANQSNTDHRIAQIGIYNYSSEGIAGTVMSRGVDNAIFRNISVGTNNTYNLGSSTAKWANVYATTFNGNLIGNVTGNATNVTGTVAIDHGGTGATTAATARTNLGLGSMATETATNYMKWQTTSSTSTALYNFGAYCAQNTAAGTGPNGSNYYNLINIPYRKASGNTKADWGWQLGNTTSNDSRMYYRTSGDNTWGDWQTIAHATTSSNDIGSATQPVYMTSTGVITAGTALKNLAYKDSLDWSELTGKPTTETLRDTLFPVTKLTKTVTLTTEWQNVGITGADLNLDGTYIIQLYLSHTGNNTLSSYYERYSGIMSWYKTTTNSSSADEIVLHRAGHAPNNNCIYLRVKRVAATSSPNTLQLQIKASADTTVEASLNFKFRWMLD